MKRSTRWSIWRCAIWPRSGRCRSATGNRHRVALRWNSPNAFPSDLSEFITVGQETPDFRRGRNGLLSAWGRGDKQLCGGTSYLCAHAHLRSPVFPFRLLSVQKEEIHVGLGTLVRKTRDG